MAISTTTLGKIKKALRLSDDDFDTELSDLADAALKDLNIAGADGTDVVQTDPLTLRAIITFCKMSFGEPDEYDRYKKSYDEQKAQLSNATNYTNWGTL